MKLILIGLTVICSTLWFPAYTQTEQVYCLPIGKARLLVSDAIRLRLTDSINTNLSAQVTLLEAQQKSSHSAFTNLLKIEQEKFQLQKEITDHTSKLSESYREQLAYITKKERKQRIQNRFLKAGIIAVGAAFGYQALK